MDFKIPLAAVLMIGGAIGLFLPGDDVAPAAADAATQRAAAEGAFTPEIQLNRLTDSTPETAVTGWAEEVILHREGDGHFYADVTVDGRDFRMLVDTGATVVALTGDDAAAMGLEWYQDEIAPVAQGASGPVEGVNTTIGRMSLGGLEASRVQAIIIPEGARTSLLGQSFLSTIGRVEIYGDRMVLGS